MTAQIGDSSRVVPKEDIEKVVNDSFALDLKTKAWWI